MHWRRGVPVAKIHCCPVDGNYRVSFAHLAHGPFPHPAAGQFRASHVPCQPQRRRATSDEFPPRRVIVVAGDRAEEGFTLIAEHCDNVVRSARSIRTVSSKVRVGRYALRRMPPAKLSMQGSPVTASRACLLSPAGPAKISCDVGSLRFLAHRACSSPEHLAGRFGGRPRASQIRAAGCPSRPVRCRGRNGHGPERRGSARRSGRPRQPAQRRGLLLRRRRPPRLQPRPLTHGTGGADGPPGGRGHR